MWGSVKSLIVTAVAGVMIAIAALAYASTAAVTAAPNRQPTAQARSSPEPTSREGAEGVQEREAQEPAQALRKAPLRSTPSANTGGDEGAGDEQARDDGAATTGRTRDHGHGWRSHHRRSRNHSRRARRRGHGLAPDRAAPAGAAHDWHRDRRGDPPVRATGTRIHGNGKRGQGSRTREGSAKSSQKCRF